MVKSIKAASQPKSSPEAFVLEAINSVKEEGKKALFSWELNKAFREYFGSELDPVATTTRMRKAGTIAVFLQKGGASFYLRSDLKESTLVRHDGDWAKRDAEDYQKPSKKPTAKGDDLLTKVLKRL